ncbi:hypothetical protein L195_g035029, partial [Trifolium pratense]
SGDINNRKLQGQRIQKPVVVDRGNNGYCSACELQSVEVVNGKVLVLALVQDFPTR